MMAVKPTNSSTRRAETAPLLAPNRDGEPNNKRATPLPLLQIVILGLVRLAEPIAFTQIFPYVNQMMEELKVTNNPSHIGFYSGVIDSMFAVAQLFTIYGWGALSDRIGRRPVILIGLLGVAISSLLFGLSHSFTTAVLARSLAGALSGNAAVVNSAISDITDETNVGQAFPISMLFWFLGCILGPLIGGSLAHGASHVPFLREHPFFLPCAVSACITVVSVMIGYFFLEETLPHKSSSMQTASAPYATLRPSKEKPSFRQLLSNDRVQRILVASFLLNFIAFGFEILFVLFSYTPITDGGIQLTPRKIGFTLAAGAVVGAILPIIIFPRLERRYPNVPLYTALTSIYPVIFALLSGVHFIASWGLKDGERGNVDAITTALVWVGVAIAMFCARFAQMAWSINMILIKNAASTPESLGAMYGLAQMASCLSRAIGPAATSSLFAFSVVHRVMGGQFVWAIMSLIGVLGVYTASRVVDSPKGDVD